MFSTFLFFILPMAVPASVRAETALTNAAAVSRHLASRPAANAPFALTAKVTAIRRSATPTAIIDNIDSLALEDESGATLVECKKPTGISVSEGDRVHLEGTIIPSFQDKTPAAILSHLEIVGHESPADPRPATFQSVQDGSLDYRLVRLTGTIRDAAQSDTSFAWVILKLVCGGNLLDVSVLSIGPDSERIRALIGSTVQIDGIVTPFDRSLRSNMGRIFWCWSAQNIKVISPPAHPLTPPELRELSGLHPSLVIKQGRHRTTGRVLATWNGNKMLLLTASRTICRVELADERLPHYGDSVEAVGFPESDLYHLNLVRATWKKTEPLPLQQDPVSVCAPDGIMVGDWLPGIVDMLHHGSVIHVSGIVRSIPGSDRSDGIMYVQDGQTTISVDISSNPQVTENLSVGCRIRATGTCVIDTPNWTPNALCQKHDRYFLVVRTPDDIEVLSRPSWWTTTRLLIAGGILLALLVVILIWNRSLIVLAERRGRELLREQIGHVRANLKIDERTRLAVDLHDSLSQNLTGISLQLDLLDRLTGRTDPTITKHLDIAARTLQSCRDELRGCIWDLRSQALDAPTLEEAIRMTLRPHLDVAKLSLRFPVPRRKLDDNTAHTLLRIIRELVSNALRHGAAKSIRIAGALDGKRLLASVQDDGIGFDPAARPNSGGGHFGLDGIRERLRHFDGKLTIDSSPGNGTKVTFTISLPDNESGDGEGHA